MLPRAAHARQVVLELCELHLELPLGADGVLGEDVEDQLRPVDDPRLERVLEVPLLRRLELVVDDQRLGAELRVRLLQLLDLALADVGARAGRGRCWTTEPTGSTPAARASSSTSASSDSSSAPGARTASTSPRSSSVGGGVASRNDYAVESASRPERSSSSNIASPSRAEDAIVEHVRGLMPQRAARTTTTPSSSTRAASCLAGHYDTVPAQDNFPGRFEDGWVARPRRDGHEGRPRGDDRARARRRAVRLPLLRPRGAAGRRELAARGSSRATVSTRTSS